MNRFYPFPVKDIGSMVYVFGSNLAGRHGKGAALEAKQRFGAVYGQGAGRMGQSYGIPTKSAVLKVLDLETIEAYVAAFRSHVYAHPLDEFYVTPIGTGYAGYQHKDIAPMFQGLERCWFSSDWKVFLE